MSAAAPPAAARNLVLRVFGDKPRHDAADRMKRVLVERSLRNIDVGHLLVQKTHEVSHKSRLRLAFLAQEQQIMAGNQPQIDLGDHCILIADDPRKQLVARGQMSDEIVVNLAFDRFGFPTALSHLAKVGRLAGQMSHMRY